MNRTEASYPARVYRAIGWVKAGPGEDCWNGGWETHLVVPTFTAVASLAFIHIHQITGSLQSANPVSRMRVAAAGGVSQCAGEVRECIPWRALYLACCDG